MRARERRARAGRARREAHFARFGGLITGSAYTVPGATLDGAEMQPVIHVGDGRNLVPMNRSGVLMGYSYRHPFKGDEDKACFGTIILGPDDHQLTQRDPVTLTPSLVCNICGDHGFIENGQWRPA